MSFQAMEPHLCRCRRFCKPLGWRSQAGLRKPWHHSGISAVGMPLVRGMWHHSLSIGIGMPLVPKRWHHSELGRRCRERSPQHTHAPFAHQALVDDRDLVRADDRGQAVRDEHLDREMSRAGTVCLSVRRSVCPSVCRSVRRSFPPRAGQEPERGSATLDIDQGESTSSEERRAWLEFHDLTNFA